MQDRKKYWVGFNMVKGIGPARTRRLLEHFGDLSAAWHAPLHGLRAAGLGEKLSAAVLESRKTIDLDRICRRIEELGIELLTWEDEGYPPRLLQIDSPPPLLYLKGGLSEKDNWSVAIVGTRRMTSYGRQVAMELADYLARQGVTIVSGLARGVDTVAHRAALQAGGRTIAVLGCGVDQVYPPENGGLVRKMFSSGLGAVLSDYSVGSPPEGPNFPPRNRIISGLALATVVIEAGEKSGASITARFALDQGREVFAVPGNIHAPQSIGTNRLIRDGAHPCLQPSDVLDVLEWVRVVQYPERPRPTLEDGLEKDIYNLILQEPAHIDEICRVLGLPADKAAAKMTLMELKGLVRLTAGKYMAARL